MTSTAEAVDAVVEAATAVPGVTGLNSGRFGEVATYLPGRRVGGVKLGDHDGEVHIEVDLRRSVTDTADAVRVAVEKAAGRPMTVVVEDVSLDDADSGHSVEAPSPAAAPERE